MGDRRGLRMTENSIAGRVVVDVVVVVVSSDPWEEVSQAGRS